MRRFAALLETLVLTPSRNAKIDAMARYFRETPDPDRGFALAAITSDLTLKNLKASGLRTLVAGRVDPDLFAMSYDYVGDMAETIALIWPDGASRQDTNTLPGVANFIAAIESCPKREIDDLVAQFLDYASANERWAMIKLATGGLRVGVSARLAKTALAHYGGQDLDEIEKIWHGLEMPYSELFAWLDGHGDKPQINSNQIFHPMMLSNPLDAERDFERLDPAAYDAEWKWDGIRVQLVIDTARNGDDNSATARMFSRTGDDISAAFPDVTTSLRGQAVLDGELLIGRPANADPASVAAITRDPQPFNRLQQRLNRKQAAKTHLRDLPAFVRVYDMLFDGDTDIRSLPITERRDRLVRFLKQDDNPRLDLSETLDFDSWQALAALRQKGTDSFGHEGLMIKKRNSSYVAGRPKGPWFKWKRDPRVIDTVMMYAQRGHGRRSSFYSDFTFGIWNGNEIVPVGKAYSGFTDAELRALDKWVRAHTTNRFGPVREVEKLLVVELAFDSAHDSPRHKSGVALRFPRINRIRWDKPAGEADTLETIRNLFDRVSG
ncbi:MAG: ATP-dependent DNA ligase [Rhodospirillaceae bacterium]|nr:ATP-dependent DNA ligase [Rhodospirillaceae bacterium]